jgi:fido (protein-threonine AMPylation protein)
MQSGNLARMGNIADMGHTNTKWSVRLEQGRSHNRVLRNTVRHSREQSLEPRQGNRDQDRVQERLRFPRTNLRHAILLRIHNFLYSDIGRTMVQQTTLATLLQ